MHNQRVSSHRPGRRESYPDSADLRTVLESMDPAVLGQRLRERRQAAGLTLTQAVKGHATDGFLSRIETGDRRPSLKLLRGLAARLGTTPHQLVLGASPAEWAARRAAIDWAHLSLRTGQAVQALEKTTDLVATLPEGASLTRRARFVHALALEGTGEFKAAAEQLENLVEETVNSEPPVDLYIALCRCLRQSGELGRAVDAGRRGLDQLTALGLEGLPQSIRLTLTLSAAYLERGDVEYAARLCQRALSRAESLDTPTERANCYWSASIVESRRGNQDQAVALAQRAVHLLDEADSLRHAAMVRSQLGILLLRLEPPQADSALKHLRRAEKSLKSCDASPADMAGNHLAQARALVIREDPEAAEALIESCLSKLEGKAPFTAAEGHELRAEIAFRRGHLDSARSECGLATALLVKAGARRAAAQLWWDLGWLLASIGCQEEALAAFRNAGGASGLRQAPVMSGHAHE